MAGNDKAAGGKTTGKAQPGSSETGSTESGGEKLRDAFTESVVEPAKRAGEAMRDTGRRIAERSGSIGVTIIDQAETNAQEAFAALRAATQAKDLTEVMKIQGEYLRDQGRRSMDQARAIGELIMQFGRDAVTPAGGKKDDG